MPIKTQLIRKYANIQTKITRTDKTVDGHSIAAFPNWLLFLFIRTKISCIPNSHILDSRVEVTIHLKTKFEKTDSLCVSQFSLNESMAA